MCFLRALDKSTADTTSGNESSSRVSLALSRSVALKERVNRVRLKNWELSHRSRSNGVGVYFCICFGCATGDRMFRA